MSRTLAAFFPPAKPRRGAERGWQRRTCHFPARVGKGGSGLFPSGRVARFAALEHGRVGPANIRVDIGEEEA